MPDDNVKPCPCCNGTGELRGEHLVRDKALTMLPGEVIGVELSNRDHHSVTIPQCIVMGWDICNEPGSQGALVLKLNVRGRVPDMMVSKYPARSIGGGTGLTATHDLNEKEMLELIRQYHAWSKDPLFKPMIVIDPRTTAIVKGV